MSAKGFEDWLPIRAYIVLKEIRREPKSTKSLAKPALNTEVEKSLTWTTLEFVQSVLAVLCYALLFIRFRNEAKWTSLLDRCP